MNKIIVKIRPLKVQDAAVSCNWRNDPEVWRLTGRKWNNSVTKEIEEEWIRLESMSERSKRFAICVNEDEQYVGNVQLTDIVGGSAQFHIFIGEKVFWGKGIGTQATEQIVEFGFKELKLREIYLHVNKDNVAAIRTYKKCGFSIVDEDETEFCMKAFNDHE